MAAGCAFLSNKDKFTIFRYGKYTIRFRAPYSLEKYTDIKEWDEGYLVVMAKYSHKEESEEESYKSQLLLLNHGFLTQEYLPTDDFPSAGEYSFYNKQSCHSSNSY